ncbi:MAG: Imm52 family immunity protein [Methylocystis sp.]
MRDPAWTEVKPTDKKRYYIQASWEGRAETPDQLAARFLRMMDAFNEIDPVFSHWTCGAKRRKNFELIRDRYAEEIAAGIELDDWGEPTPVCGYWFGAITRDTPRNRSFSVRCNASATLKSAFPNHIQLSTFSSADPRPDADVVAYPVFYSALRAIVDAWDPVRAGAYSQQLIQLNESASRFPAAWIQYLCPWLAEKITPPSTVLAEHSPDGGLLMTATTETFDIDNPAHIKAAQDIAAAMAPLNELPWPSPRASSNSR